jgi:hypothetical protein
MIMASGYDDWVYWHFFTITIYYNCSHIEFLLNDVCLTSEFMNPESESYVTTDGESAPIRDLGPDFCYCQTVAALLM